MNKQELDPPREAWETADYEDDPFGLGDIDETKLKLVSKDFLPKPEELVFKQTLRKVTITLDPGQSRTRNLTGVPPKAIG
jgi:hypothetical protein